MPFTSDDLFTNPGPNSGIHTTAGSTLQTTSIKQSTLLQMGATTAMLLKAETKPGPIALSEAAPVIEEAAILFANGQTDMIEPILRHAIEDDTLGNMPLAVWGMLFDLYQITGRREQFENLALDYAGRFERSPPAWIEPDASEQDLSAAQKKGNIPGVAFAGKLDAGIVKQLERLRNLGEMSEVLRLDFTRITEVDPVGCGLLHNVLKRLQRSGHRLSLVGANELTGKIRTILAVGRRDETEAPWLLLLELLRLLDRETDFEETSIDYCVTFEVSPPAFTPPQDAIVTVSEETDGSIGANESSGHFVMPAVVSSKNDHLIAQIHEYAAIHQPAVLDCTRLVRMDFAAASQLFSSLTPLIQSGRTIELVNANHFIAALCHVMGFQDLIRILPRKS
ncbi:STAS domain-containing protein [uncultured Oxalicibacterium sp.]|uniref:STAS domain-containing protein n=1 Tax=uncultured Oxalicibacterium sp. TaxID=1168540 RepID=UPI0025E1836C|nr:STAS domain-containing protein [uncultured Oxalicibacterium sp.]